MGAIEVLSALDRIHGTVSVIGSMNADYTVTAQRLPGPGETITGGPLQLLPGGKSGNQAAAAARIGATVQMFGAVGSDSNAEFLGRCEHHAWAPRARPERNHRDHRGRGRREHHRVFSGLQRTGDRGLCGIRTRGAGAFFRARLVPRKSDRDGDRRRAHLP